MTTYLVLSDVHGNLPALEAVLSDAGPARPDVVLCLGDLVGYGTFPDECVELLRSTGAHCIAGNHDLIATGALDAARCSPLARRTLEWTRQALDPATRRYLEQLPVTRLVDDLCLAHGSPDDVEEYVTRPERAASLLRRSSARFLLLGHTHHQWAVDEGGRARLRRRAGDVLLGAGRWVLNPGSVGQSRDRDTLARYLLLDVRTGTASFRAVHYDVPRAAEAVLRAGLPVRVLSPTESLPVRLVKSGRRRAAARLRRTSAWRRSG